MARLPSPPARRLSATTLSLAAAVLVLAVAAAVAVLAIAAGSDAPGEETARDPFLRGPYLTRVTETGARLRWLTEGGAPVEIVAVAPDGRRTPAREGVLSGLVPDTAYRWEASVDGVVHADGRLTTAPTELTGRISFVVFGDYGAATEGERAVGRLAASLAPRLIVTTGDSSYLVALPELLDENIFMPLREAMAVAPNIGVLGDHDIVFPHGRRALVEALEWPGGGDRYDLRYGPVQLVGIGLRADRDDLAFAARALARPGPAARFVVVHQPPKAGNPILPLLARAGVSAVLAGHLHAYERRESAEAPGVPLFTVGTGGAPASANGTPRSDDARVYLVRFGLLRVDVEPGRISYRFLDTAGRVHDTLVRPLP